MRLPLGSEADVVAAMLAGREVAGGVGLSDVEAQHVATAVSEVATNVWKYAGGGEVVIEALEAAERRGVRIEVRDEGPGIADLQAALRDGVSTGGGLGLGLPGARRLMDEFHVESAPGRGTLVRMAKWAGGLVGGAPHARWDLRSTAAARAFAQPLRNGVLFGLAVGERAADAAACCLSQPWRAPAELAAACAGLLRPGERLGLAVASASTLDGALMWLRAGELQAALVRPVPRGHTIVRVPALPALEPGTAAGLSARTALVRRDDVLVLAAERLDDDELPRLAATAPELSGAGGACCLVRFERGSLEPRRR